MSIVDALLRAKQLAQERATAGERSEQPRKLETQQSFVEPTVSANQSKGKKSKVAVELPFSELAQVAINPKKLTLNLVSCAKHHIVVPDIEEKMGQKASPPYRMLRAQFLQRCRAQNWSTIAVTSPGPNEGKSTTALNLAISIAREGNYDVFLLDLDLRNPSICQYLGVKPGHDLAGFFAGKSELHEVFFTIGIDRLVVSGGLAGTPNASELLATNRLEQMVAFIRRASAKSLILLDLPPVVVTDDALVVAPRIDATLLVVSEGQTRRDGLERAIGLLSEHTVAGVVLNQTRESIGTQYYSD